MRILFAPHEICGQMQLLAETFQERGYDSLAVTHAQNGLGNKSHQLQIISGRSRVSRLVFGSQFLLQALRKYDVFHFFFGRSLIPGMYDLPLIKRCQKKIYVHFRGSDIRNGSAIHSVEQQAASKINNPPPLQLPHQKKRLDCWRKYADKIFVSTPDLLKIAPEATLIPQAISLKRSVANNVEIKTNINQTRIVHAPSKRSFKGTKHVLKAIRILKSMGYNIELDLIENTSHEDAMRRYQNADIAIDQLLIGWYGNFSVEMMTLGKPIICYIDPELKPFRQDCPIESATPANLVDVLKKLIDDQDRRKRLGQQGIEYVNKYHDVNVIVDRLIDIYRGNTSSPGKGNILHSSVS